MKYQERVYKLVTEIVKADEQPERKMSGATRAYRKAATDSWKQGGRAGELIHRAAGAERSGSYINKLHAKTMRRVSKRLSKQSIANLSAAIRLKPHVPQSRTRQAIRTRDVKLP
jgi:hypothetical protein